MSAPSLNGSRSQEQVGGFAFDRSPSLFRVGAGHCRVVWCCDSGAICLAMNRNQPIAACHEKVCLAYITQGVRALRERKRGRSISAANNSVFHRCVCGSANSKRRGRTSARRLPLLFERAGFYSYELTFPLLIQLSLRFHARFSASLQ